MAGMAVCKQQVLPTQEVMRFEDSDKGVPMVQQQAGERTKRGGQ